MSPAKHFTKLTTERRREYYSLVLSTLTRMISDRSSHPVDTGRKLNVHKTLRRRPGRLLNVLCTFNLRSMSTGQLKSTKNDSKRVTILLPQLAIVRLL